MNLMKKALPAGEPNHRMMEQIATRKACVMAAFVALCTAAAGQVPVQPAEQPQAVLRAISVYEWVGPIGKPKACRIVPVSVYDGEQLQDGTVYLSRPEPLAIAPQVEYEVEQSGHPVELFAVQNAARVEGNWVGLGNPLPLPAEKRQRQKPTAEKIDDFGESDRPVLHRKYPAKNTGDQTQSTGDQTTASKEQADESDRPQLHRKSDAGSSNPGTQDQTASKPSSTTQADDSDRPQLHRKSDESSTGSGAENDSDRPVLHKPRRQPDASSGNEEEIDPNRPRLRRGKMGEQQLVLTPQLKGLPDDMNQAVAVSDAATRPEHLWKYHWADPADEEKMKSALEQMARDAMGMTPPAKPPVKNARSAKTKKPAAPVEPAALGDENFKSFELAYNSNATLVLTATNNKTGKEAKYITLIAQPDLYGNPMVVFKQVTDLVHLDETPRMRLVDAVDAMADHRGELLFELRTSYDRQFALYRVYRGTAEKIFTTGVPQE